MNELDPNEEVIFNAARQFADAEKVRRYLDLACEGKPEMREGIERLLATAADADSFFGRNAVFPKNVLAPVAALASAQTSSGADEQAGTIIGRYKLLQKIGEGGMGVVYMAEQAEPVRRRVALKIIKLGMDTKQVVARFEAERQALALMDHPNIAKVLDGGATDTGSPYFVMELVQGVPITEFCDKNRLPAEERIKLFIQVCQAIQSAHQKGIIHRDLKPTNIMVTLNAGVPQPMVIDFGVAKATQQKLTEKTVFTNFATMIGTPAYMSPEQAEMSRLDVDTRSDIYGLGVLLYELLTGTTPFPEKRLRSASYQEMQRIIMEEEPERPSTRLTKELVAAEVTRRTSGDAEKSASSHPAPTSREGRAPRVPDLSTDLDCIVMKCLEKDRERRYETASGLAADLKRHLDNEPVVARPPSAAYRFQKLVKRNKTAFAVATVIGAVLVAATGISAWQAVRATRAEKLAAARLIESENARTEAEAISKFLTQVFQSPDPARDGRTITVAETLGAAAKKLETDLASQPAQRAKLQATLGSTYYALGLNREAIPLQEKVRDYYLATSGPENTNTIKAMGSLVNSYDEAGRRDEALKLSEQVLALFRKVSGPEYPDTLKAMNNLGISYAEAGRPAEALKLFEEALALYRKVSGPEDPATLSAMQNVVICYDTLGRRDEAIKLGEELLALRRKVSGPENPDTLGAMNTLADSYSDAGRRDEALKLRQELLALCRKVLGPENPHTLSSMLNVAVSYKDAGRLDEAIKLREEVLALRRKVLGPAHPDTLNDLNDIASALATWDASEIRNGTNALNLAQEAVAATHRTNPDYLDTLAAAYAETQQFDKAVAAEQEAIGLAQSEQKKKDYASRLELYQAHKPYRQHGKP